MTKGTDMDRISEILEGLIKRTEEGKLTWRTSVNPDTFITAVDTIGIVVKLQDDFLETYRIEIQNDEGLTVQVLQTPDSLRRVKAENEVNPEQAQELSRIFALARSSALNSDLTLKKLAENLAKR